MYRIPDDVMERLLRDLGSAKKSLNDNLRHRYDENEADARNIIANVRDELAQYKEEK
jgi:hypothetical protein